MRDAPKAIRDVNTQLSNLQDTVKQIEKEPRLCTDTVHAQLDTVQSIIMELRDILENMKKWQNRSPLRQGLHAFHCRGRDEERLRGLLKRIRIANQELSIRLQLATVSIVAGLEGSLKVAETGGQSEDEKSKEKIQEELRQWASLKQTIERNVAEISSKQVNAIFGFEQTETPTTARISGNNALDNSSQSNIISGDSISSDALKRLWHV